MRVASSAARDLRGRFHEIAFYGLHPSGRQVGRAVGGKGRCRFQWQRARFAVIASPARGRWYICSASFQGLFGRLRAVRGRYYI